MLAGLSPPIRDPFVVTVEILRADMLEEPPNFLLQADFFPTTAPHRGIVEKVFNLFAHEIPIDAEGEIAWQSFAVCRACKTALLNRDWSLWP
jgi:hypothetical protein